MKFLNIKNNYFRYFNLTINPKINEHATKLTPETSKYNISFSINIPYKNAINVAVVHKIYVLIFALGFL